MDHVFFVRLSTLMQILLLFLNFAAELLAATVMFGALHAVRVATQYAPPLSSRSGRQSASRRQADQNIVVRSHADRCSYLTP